MRCEVQHEMVWLLLAASGRQCIGKTGSPWPGFEWCPHVQVHGILMVSAFGVIIPLGVFTSRYGKAWKHWFNTHRAVQVGVFSK
jgi:hypothetical protein